MTQRNTPGMIVADDDDPQPNCPYGTVARYSSCYYNHTMSPARSNQAAFAILAAVDAAAPPKPPVVWAPSDSSDCWGVSAEVGRVLSFGGFGCCGLTLSAICLLSRSTMPERAKDSLVNVMLVGATGLGLGGGVFWTFTDEMSAMLATHSRNVGLTRRPAVPVACSKPRSRCLRKKCVAEDCVTLANGGTDCYCIETECGNTQRSTSSPPRPAAAASASASARSHLTSPTSHRTNDTPAERGYGTEAEFIYGGCVGGATASSWEWIGLKGQVDLSVDYPAGMFPHGTDVTRLRNGQGTSLNFRPYLTTILL